MSSPFGYRAISPVETLANIRPFLADMGITRVANVTGLDTVGIPTVMVTRPNSRCLSVTQGKGVTLDAAKASGVMEAVEQFHAECIELPLKLTTERELGRKHLVAKSSRLPQYKHPYHEDCRVLWIEGTKILSQAPVWVPFEMVHLDLTLPLPTGSGFFLPGSTGLASGNNRAEAILHGLYEVLERDALSLFYQMSGSQQSARRINLSTVDHPIAMDLLARYDRAGVDVAVWDITSDVNVASFLCMIVDRETEAFHPVGPARGSGTHSDRELALERALCEAAQSRLTRIVGTRDDLSAASAEDTRLQEALLQARVQVSQTPTARILTEVASALFNSTETAIESACAKLLDLGLEEPIQVDLSRSEYPIAVVRTLVPGLEGASQVPGYVPGPRAREIGGLTA